MIGYVTSLRIVRDIGQWWLEQMEELLPGILRRPKRREIQFVLDPDGSLNPDDLHHLPRPPARRRFFQSRPLKIALILPQGSILEREVTLPRAVGVQAEKTIGYDLERLTPFSANEVAWSVIPEPEGSRNGKMAFRLLIAPIALFEPAMNVLRRHGIAPTRLRTNQSQGSKDTILLSTPEHRRHGLGRSACGLAIAVMVAPFVMQEISIFRLDRAISALSTQRQQTENLRQKLSGLTAGRAALAQEERRVGSPLTVLRTLTEALPDDTFLTVLNLHEHHVMLEGQSNHATQLIGILEHHAAFTNASFAGPVTRSNNHRKDLFSLNADTPG